MRSLAVYLKNYKKESILAPFFKFLEVVFDLIVPIIIAQIIDVGIANHDNGYIIQRFFILILMAAFGLTCSITAQFFAAKARKHGGRPHYFNKRQKRNKQRAYLPYFNVVSYH